MRYANDEENRQDGKDAKGLVRLGALGVLGGLSVRRSVLLISVVGDLT